MSALRPDSHTARRLEHATPSHIHHTTRRTFIGPIPQGWLKSHRKAWYNDYIGFGNRAPTFTATQASVSESVSSEQQQDGGFGETPRPSSQTDAQSSERALALENTTSLTSLLHHDRRTQGAPATEEAAGNAEAAPNETSSREQTAPTARLSVNAIGRAVSRLEAPRVRFSEATTLQLRSRAQRLAAGGSFRRTKIKPGELLKMEKMLVRIDITRQTIGSDFDERLSLGVETKSLDKWREFMVVCRKHEDGALIELYQTRVISTRADVTKRKPKVQLLLRDKGDGAKVNMYSSLDKTLCIWQLDRATTYIYYLRPLSGAASVEWLSFLRGVQGHERNNSLHVFVPDLSVSLRLDDPFRTEELSATLAQAAEGNESAIAKAINDEKGAAGAIVARCMSMLQNSPEWADIIKQWSVHDRVGLAWKRYDRLEWVHGAVEQRMYGTVAMQRTHDLELRPKDHYPQSAMTPKGKTLEEPPPIEGFLIRLTSQGGQERRMGRLLFKRLYFTTQDQYIVFLQPSRAAPPHLLKRHGQQSTVVPSAEQISEDVPLVSDINPYPLENDKIAWLDTEGVKSVLEQRDHDNNAAIEYHRNIDMLLACDGLIDMRDIRRVRKYHKGATPVDDELDSEGSDVDFDEPIRDRPEDGRTSSVDQERVFELLMNNGLVIRLQAYDKAAKKEWIKRLRKLVKYWRHRSREDMDLFKAAREQNLETLQIDERAEAQVGSFAYKWEVSHSYADPSLYNMCGIASCRTIHMSGLLFRKPRRHTTFNRCRVILSAGHLLIFQDTLRKRTGQKLVHIHHDRIASIDLRGCYLYSGLLTENDLLYQNQTFDSNTPGHHALPRVYLEDAWTSTDEDAMTTFVIWHAKSKSWFRSSQFVDDARRSEREVSRAAERSSASDGLRSTGAAKTKTKLERVSKLGATGRSVVFKARSRAERDQWVLAIQVEIERLAVQTDEVRLVHSGEQS